MNQIANVRKAFALRPVGLWLVAGLLARILLVMVVSVAVIFAGIHLALVGVVMMRPTVRRLFHVRRPSVNVKLYSHDPSADLAIEVQMKITQLHLGKLPFEC